MAATVTMVTANVNEAFVLANDDQFAHLRKTVLKLVEASESNVHEALLFIQTNWSASIKEKEEVDRGLDLLLYVYRDIVALKAGLESDTSIPRSKRIFRRACNEDDV